MANRTNRDVTNIQDPYADAVARAQQCWHRLSQPEVHALVTLTRGANAYSAAVLSMCDKRTIDWHLSNAYRALEFPAGSCPRMMAARVVHERFGPGPFGQIKDCRGTRINGVVPGLNGVACGFEVRK